MSNSHRIRTELGVSKNIQVKLDQDYDFLEILSFKIFQSDVYTRSCADYGVVCGRVFANRGLGLPNAKVSIFIPLSEEDETNPVISTLYPYKDIQSANDDGYKYNLLPYSPSYSNHVPVGTFPDRIDALTDKSIIEVYDKYYKFTCRTNDSGDFMFFGLPLGQQTVFMQVDLSDIGQFSLTPQDLIRMGLATEDQVDGTKFRFSENYSELPQIITLAKTINVSPFFGQKEVCDYNVGRCDFDLTSEANIKFQPTAIFMGSIISTSDKMKIKKNCKAKSKAGFQCQLTTGSGQIEAIRQTIYSDENSRPVLEQYKIENDGKVIDDNGNWVIEVPMNLDYVYTNENGDQIISNDPTVGVPTKGKYRFKVKWGQSSRLSEEIRRGYFIVPNIKEYGWADTDVNADPLTSGGYDTSPASDPAINNIITISYYNDFVYRILDTNNVSSYKVFVNGVEKPEYFKTIPLYKLNPTDEIQIQVTPEDDELPSSVERILIYKQRYLAESSYAFSLSWEEYANPANAIDCLDTFYELQYNKVYTISQLLDRYGTRRFVRNTIQIKNIQDDACDGDYNKFPINDVYYRLDALFIILQFLLNYLKYISIPIIVIMHVLAFLWPVFAVIIIIVQLIISIVVLICNGLNKIANLVGGKINCPPYPEINGDIFNQNPFRNLTLPLILYTDDGCERCNCNTEGVNVSDNSVAQSLDEWAGQINTSALADFTSAGFWDTTLDVLLDDGWHTALTAKVDDTYPNDTRIWQDESPNTILSTSLPPAEMFNLFNTRAKYFDNMPSHYNGAFFDNTNSLVRVDGWNQIKVQWCPEIPSNEGKYHKDNTFIMLMDENGEVYQPGQILTFQDPAMSSDPNINSTIGTTNTSISNGTNITVYYANPDFTQWVNPNPDGKRLQTTYFISATTGTTTSKFKCDLEYFQVLTAMTVNEFTQVANFTLNDHDFDYYAEPSHLSFLRRYLMQHINTIRHTGSGTFVFCENRLRVEVGYNYFSNADYGGIAENRPVDAEQNPAFIWNNSSAYPNLKVVICQRGVDINSPKIKQKIDLSRLFGRLNYGENPQYVIEGSYRMNVPIQPNYAGTPTSINNVTCKAHYNVNDNGNSTFHPDNNYSNGIFFPSYVFQYSNDFIPFTTNLHLYYSALGTNYNSVDNLPSYYGSTNWLDPGPFIWNLYNGTGSKQIISPNNFTFPASLRTYMDDSQPVGNDISLYVPYGVDAVSNGLTKQTYYNLIFCGDPGLYYTSKYNLIPNVTFALSETSWFSDTGNIRYPTAYFGFESVDGASYFARDVYMSGNGVPDFQYSLPNYDKYYSTIYLQHIPDHTINVSNRKNIVFRSDRLPSSTSVAYSNGEAKNAFLLHQNPNFAIYKFSDNNGTYETISAPIPSQAQSGEVSTEEYPSQYSDLIDSLSQCDKAVNLGCYGVENDGTPFILPTEQCTKDNNNNTIFKYGSGCYTLVSRPFISLFRDYKSIVEWTQRTKINWALCFDVFAHSFGNNWINGTLFAYSFQNQTTFNSQNEPLREFCDYTLAYHEPTKSYYYRVSPFAVSNFNDLNTGIFIGQPPHPRTGQNNTQKGNIRQLMYPTTILDLGPKNDYLQEIAYNDDFDGYVIQKLPSTTFNDVTDLLNVFILSRLVNQSFISLLIPISDDPNEGGDDPSVQAFFQNTRWGDGGVGNLVGNLIDGDYAQMVSINSEYGVNPYSPERYNNPNTSLFFGNDNQSGTYPIFGIFFSSDNQLRDYIAPRRTIWNPVAPFPPTVTDVTNIPIKTQEVPFYQWRIRNDQSSTIFGSQNNRSETNYQDYSPTGFFSHEYQSLDRLDFGSQYFKVNSDLNSSYYKGYIINFDDNGSPTPDQPNGMLEYVTQGAPFHFYFGLINGSSSLDKFRQKYIDTTIVYE